MRGFDHATILSPSFHGLRKERLAQWPAFCVPKFDQKFRGYFQKNWMGVCCTLQETLTLFQTKICDFPYPISDLIKNLIPYFIPEALEPGAWQNGRIQTKPAKKPYLWRGTYLYSLYKGRKTRCRLRVSLLTQARLIRTVMREVIVGDLI